MDPSPYWLRPPPINQAATASNAKYSLLLCCYRSIVVIFVGVIISVVGALGLLVER